MGKGCTENARDSQKKLLEPVLGEQKTVFNVPIKKEQVDTENILELVIIFFHGH